MHRHITNAQKIGKIENVCKLSWHFHCYQNNPILLIFSQSTGRDADRNYGEFQLYSRSTLWHISHFSLTPASSEYSNVDHLATIVSSATVIRHSYLYVDLLLTFNK